jgi:hypothetical protein
MAITENTRLVPPGLVQINIGPEIGPTNNICCCTVTTYKTMFAFSLIITSVVWGLGWFAQIFSRNPRVLGVIYLTGLTLAVINIIWKCFEGCIGCID